MSTGANCILREIKPGEWFYSLQRWPYGESPDYDKFGPFPTEQAALDHLDAHHANPGGWSTIPFKGSADIKSGSRS